MSRLAGFADLFTRPTWARALLLVVGAVLAPGKRTVTAALRMLGRDQENDFPAYHAVLSRAAWSSRAAARQLLCLLVGVFAPSGATVLIGLDDTIERRWGAKINARGIYRDPVRSSKGHFVKTSGLRWLSAQLLVQVPWAGRIMGLPFLTVLAPSARFYADKPRAPKTLIDWARQAALQIHRWLPDRCIVMVADSAFAAIEFLSTVGPYICVVTRLRLDANLFAPAPPRRQGRGRPPVKGRRLPKLDKYLRDPATVWRPTPSPCGTDKNSVSSKSPVTPPSGITPASRRFPSAGFSCAIPPANSKPRPSSQPTSMPIRPTFSNGSSLVGRSRSPSRKPAPILASKPSDNGQTSPSCAPPQPS